MATNTNTPPSGGPITGSGVTTESLVKPTEAQIQAAKDANKPMPQATQATQAKPKMKVSACRVRLSKDQDVFVKEITPAEALLLTAEHHKNVGDAVVHDLTPVQDRTVKKVLDKDGKHIDNEVSHKDRIEIERTPAEEVQRLRSKYGKKKVEALFPGAIPQLPSSFEEAQTIGLQTVMPEDKLSLGEIKV